MATRAYQTLATRYRPQTFAEVVGQHAATAALSRVCAQGSPAPAYLLSGTRGVGKTTIARIFAKALNCARGPAGEPCNDCPQCGHITAGNHVDVCEIDAASNTGVDDVRALRENLGFMPMEGKFKIFIVDEAHMLSKSAFNALLKTLEEPPSHTVFIFATTEAHRFPATIISRCQHYIFRHLPEKTIYDHLCDIMRKEGKPFEEAGLRIIATRAAGSVRDSLSLLDQALCLGSGEITEDIVRQSLGVVGRDFYERCFGGMAEGNLGEIVSLTGELLSTGVDLGFFLRELAERLRSLFLLRQTEGRILPSLNVTDDEGAFLKSAAPLFSIGHLHAAWQMVLQNQRPILQSGQPGQGIELLLLNLAMLPSLAPIEKAPIKTPATGLQEKSPTYGEEKGPRPEPDTEPPKPELTWSGFCEFCRKAPAEETPPPDVLRTLKANWQGNKLTITAESVQLWERLKQNRRLFNAALQAYCQGNPPEIEFIEPAPKKTRQELIADCANNPEIKLCQEIMGAKIADCVEKGASHEKHE